MNDIIQQLVSKKISDFHCLDTFHSGIESMDKFIREDFRISVETIIALHSFNYENTFYSKPRYPALDIAYLAVQEQYRGQGIGTAIIELIADETRTQTFAGCQFLTVEALATREYSAVGIYERCGFTPNELKNPNKDTLRMYMTLYAKSEEWEEEQD